jgi:Domain of unknown function (DUF3841)
MRLWTIQTQGAWEKLQKDGILIASQEFIHPDFLPAYSWLNDQMSLRLPPKPAAVTFPIWAWYQWQDAKQSRPDLRRRGHLLSGERGVLLECIIPDQLVLLSDFHLWHYVLNYWYLAKDEAEALLFEEKVQQKGVPINQKPFADAELHIQVTDSWHRIFDLDWVDETGYVSIGTKDDKSIQATFWELRLEQVRKVQPFLVR